MPRLRFLAALLAFALLGGGCASEAPTLVEEPAYEPAPLSALVLVTPSGLEPAELELRHEGTVLFWNATGAELLVISVEGQVPPGSEGFRQFGTRAVTDPPLAPGAAAALGVSPGTTLRYEASGATLREGRIVRKDP